MVNGIEMVFSKDTMLKRIEAEGLMDRVDDDVLAIMDNLDGQPVSTACWARQVMDEPVYSCTGKDGTVLNVYECDCIPK